VPAPSLPTAGLALALAAGMTSCVPHPVENAAGDVGWPGYNNGYDGQRYAPLTEINAGNAKSLVRFCSLKIADAGAFQAGPLVIGGTIYVTSARATVALDARNCAPRWHVEYTPEGPEGLPISRGAAVLDGRLFRGASDGRLLALDAATGNLLWKTPVANTVKGEGLTSAPIAWRGLVFIGTSGGEMGIKGRMMAFDAATGREIWRFDTIPTGDQPGADTWQVRDTALKGGGGMWSSYTLDPATGELFVPVGNPAPDMLPAFRPGKNLYTNSLVVLDARTGALKWWYQIKSPDNADHDLGAAPLLFRDSGGRQMVAMAGKDGYAYGVERATHQLLFRTPVTTIRNEGAPLTPEGVMVCPGPSGGTKWNGPAFDPIRKTLFVAATDWCALLKPGEPDYVEGRPYFGGSFEFDKTPGAASGWVTALDSDSGKVRWRYNLGAMTASAVTPTAGGVVFTGDAKGDFLVLDSATGALLLQKPMDGALAGGMVTYAVDGKQFVAFTTGNISRSTNEKAGVPTLVIMGLADGVHPAEAQPDAAVAPAVEAALKPGDTLRGKVLYRQSCAACHGADGTALAGHSLKGINARLDRAQLVAWIKDPKPPMPKLYPSPFGPQDVEDIAAYAEGF
jgi:alcohol dehydrogenase (cytochrome c)